MSSDVQIFLAILNERNREMNSLATRVTIKIIQLPVVDILSLKIRILPSEFGLYNCCQVLKYFLCMALEKKSFFHFGFNKNNFGYIFFYDNNRICILHIYKCKIPNNLWVEFREERDTVLNFVESSSKGGVHVATESSDKKKSG